MPMPTTLAPVARAADLMEVGLHVRHAVVSWGFSLETAKEADGVSDAISEGLLSMLAERRVTFDRPGHPAILGSEAAAAFTADVLRPAAETRHAMSAMLKVVAEANYQQLLASGGRDRAWCPTWAAFVLFCWIGSGGHEGLYRNAGFVGGDREVQGWGIGA